MNINQEFARTPLDKDLYERLIANEKPFLFDDNGFLDEEELMVFIGFNRYGLCEEDVPYTLSPLFRFINNLLKGDQYLAASLKDGTPFILRNGDKIKVPQNITVNCLI